MTMEEKLKAHGRMLGKTLQRLERLFPHVVHPSDDVRDARDFVTWRELNENVLRRLLGLKRDRDTAVSRITDLEAGNTDWDREIVDRLTGLEEDVVKVSTEVSESARTTRCHAAECRAAIETRLTTLEREDRKASRAGVKQLFDTAKAEMDGIKHAHTQHEKIITVLRSKVVNLEAWYQNQINEGTNGCEACGADHARLAKRVERLERMDLTTNTVNQLTDRLHALESEPRITGDVSQLAEKTENIRVYMARHQTRIYELEQDSREWRSHTERIARLEQEGLGLRNITGLHVERLEALEDNAHTPLEIEVNPGQRIAVLARLNDLTIRINKLRSDLGAGMRLNAENIERHASALEEHDGRLDTAAAQHGETNARIKEHYNAVVGRIEILWGALQKHSHFQSDHGLKPSAEFLASDFNDRLQKLEQQRGIIVSRPAKELVQEGFDNLEIVITQTVEEAAKERFRHRTADERGAGSCPGCGGFTACHCEGDEHRGQGKPMSPKEHIEVERKHRERYRVPNFGPAPEPDAEVDLTVLSTTPADDPCDPEPPRRTVRAVTGMPAVHVEETPADKVPPFTEMASGPFSDITFERPAVAPEQNGRPRSDGEMAKSGRCHGCGGAYNCTCQDKGDE